MKNINKLTLVTPTAKLKQYLNTYPLDQILYAEFTKNNLPSQAHLHNVFISYTS